MGPFDQPAFIYPYETLRCVFKNYALRGITDVDVCSLLVKSQPNNGRDVPLYSASRDGLVIGHADQK